MTSSSVGSVAWSAERTCTDGNTRSPSAVAKGPPLGSDAYPSASQASRQRARSESSRHATSRPTWSNLRSMRDRRSCRCVGASDPSTAAGSWSRRSDAAWASRSASRRALAVTSSGRTPRVASASTTAGSEASRSTRVTKSNSRADDGRRPSQLRRRRHWSSRGDPGAMDSWCRGVPTSVIAT